MAVAKSAFVSWNEKFFSTCSHQAADIYYHFLSLVHRRNGHELIAAVEVQSAGEDVGAGESLEAQLSAVCAAAYGLNLGRYAACAHGLQSCLHNMHHRFYLLAHVVILVLDFHLGTAGELGVDFTHQMLYLLFALLKTCAVVIADNIVERGLLHRAADAYQMIEALVTLCVFGSFGARKHGDELIGDAYGVEHFVLCITRMHVAALEGDAGAGGVEVLIFKFAYGAYSAPPSAPPSMV